ncbi:MAG: leucine-rich repeat protein [Syntrophobacteraceae bacterium]
MNKREYVVTPVINWQPIAGQMDMKNTFTRRLYATLLALLIPVFVLPIINVYAGTTPNGLVYTEYELYISIIGYTGGGGEVVIPAQIIDKPVVEIADFAFQNSEYHPSINCDKITSVSIPDTVNRIGIYAFSECYNIASINIPDSIVTIGARAFQHCKALTDIVFGKGVAYIGDNAFHNCTGLTSVTLPPLIHRVYDSAFYNCTNLTTVIIPAGVTVLEEYAFGNTKLRDVYFLGDAPGIGTVAFGGCYATYCGPDGPFTMHFYEFNHGFALGTWIPDPSEPWQFFNTEYIGTYSGANLEEGTETRTSDTTATVTFTSDEAGWIFYVVVDKGVVPVTVGVSGSGRGCQPGDNTLSLTAQDNLTAGEKDVYIKVKDFDGNSSPMLKIELSAYAGQAPAVLIGSPSATSTGSGPITYTVTYTGAETITLAAEDVTLNRTGTVNGTVSVSGSGNTTRTVTIWSITGNGTLGISIAAGTATDSFGVSALEAGPSATFSVENTDMAPVLFLLLDG